MQQNKVTKPWTIITCPAGPDKISRASRECAEMSRLESGDRLQAVREFADFHI